MRIHAFLFLETESEFLHRYDPVFVGVELLKEFNEKGFLFRSKNLRDNIRQNHRFQLIFELNNDKITRKVATLSIKDKYLLELDVRAKCSWIKG